MSDGGGETLEVWLSQGSMMLGQPWLFLGDVLITPVMLLVETNFALAAAQSDDRAIAGGPFGWLLSLLPVWTCVPLDAHPFAMLRLHDRLHVPATARDELRSASDGASVEWLAHWYEVNWAEQSPNVADSVRYWVTAVRLGPPPPPTAK